MSAVIRPHATEQEIQTQVLLAEMAALSKEVQTTPRAIKLKRSHEALMSIRQIADVESIRASVWSEASQAVKHICVRLIGLDKTCAKFPLSRFDALQRAGMHAELDMLIAELQEIKRALNGGQIDGGTS
jgi:hypothetical protein